MEKKKNGKRETMTQTMSQTMTPGRILCLVLGICGVLWFLPPFVCGVYNIGGSLGMAISVSFLAGSLLLPLFAPAWSETGKKWCRRIFYGGVCLGGGWVLFLSGCMISGTLQSLPPEEPHTVVILGSKVNGTVPSADLQQRIQTAEAYLKAHPEVKAVASGGKCQGEEISEAKAIQTALVASGISPDRIFLEERSSSTWENLQYTKEILEEEGLSQTVVLVTDEYHQFRAQQMARQQGLTAFGVCAPTPWYIFSACWARELLALTWWFFFL